VHFKKLKANKDKNLGHSTFLKSIKSRCFLQERQQEVPALLTSAPTLYGFFQKFLAFLRSVTWIMFHKAKKNSAEGKNDDV